MNDVTLVDTHAHVMDRAFANDLDAVLDRARAAGVVGMVLVGYDLPTSQAAVRLARTVPGTVAAVGIHPNESGAAFHNDFPAIEAMARSGAVAAIGETGLDYYRDRSPPAIQQTSLEAHLRLAEELHLPIVIHNRQADGDTANALEASAGRRSHGEAPGLLHCFSSEDPTYLDRMLAAGYYVSFAGPLTYPGAGALRDAAQRVPIDRLLVETDCPYLAPQPVRGKRNEPAFVRHTAERLATLRGVSLAELSHSLWANSLRLFPRLKETVAV